MTAASASKEGVNVDLLGMMNRLNTLYEHGLRLQLLRRSIPSRCRTCGAPKRGKLCARCLGQPDTPGPLSIRYHAGPTPPR